MTKRWRDNVSERTTWIRNASWVIAWDAATARHRYLRDGDVVFRGNTISFVGRSYEGTSDTLVDGAGLMVMPGLVDVHAHPALEPIGKGYYEDLGSHKLYMNRLYEFYLSLLPDAETAAVATDEALCELLTSAVTTVVDLGLPFPGWADRLAASGMRAYLAPLFQSARWHMPSGHEVVYTWDEPAGEKGLDQALALIEDARRHPSGRLDGVLAPTTADTSSAALLQRTKREAERRKLCIQLHTAVTLVEFQEMVRRHGQSAVQWLSELGFLGPNVTLAHAIFLDHHPWLHWHTRNDLSLLARSGTSVAHLPLVAAQRGNLMHSFGGYRAAGVNVAIGTDTYPLNMLEEMRFAGLMSKVATGHVDLLRTEDIFWAATIGGAKALGRDDIGRLAPGAKADLALIDLAHPLMIPLRDPLKNLIYTATDKPVRDVYVDGRQIVANREVLTIDRAAALAGLQRGQERALAAVPKFDRLQRSAETIAPLSLAPVDEAVGN
jgi:cytosine/adenosine deaminase-related metal-dependent hydrolase